MTAAYQIPETYRAAPWRQVTNAQLRPAAGAPTMLHRNEQRIYYWLTRNQIAGPGAVVELGSFVGGSTARLGQGLNDAGSDAALHAYDRFTADPAAKAKHLYAHGIAEFAGKDILPLARRLLAPYAARLHLHAGDIMEQSWTGEPIALLLLDACKTPALTDHIAAQFFPSLVAGRSIINQQDFLEWNQFWLPCQMLMLQDHFRPIAAPGGGSVLYLCTRVPSLADLRAARVTGLDDAALAEAIRTSMARYRGWGLGRHLRMMLEAIAMNPGERLPWRMRSPRLVARARADHGADRCADRGADRGARAV